MSNGLSTSLFVTSHSLDGAIHYRTVHMLQETCEMLNSFLHTNVIIIGKLGLIITKLATNHQCIQFFLPKDLMNKSYKKYNCWLCISKTAVLSNCN